jgi:hypothetical protein
VVLARNARRGPPDTSAMIPAVLYGNTAPRKRREILDEPDFVKLVESVT